MTNEKAVEILKDMNEWRRHDDDTPRELPHSPKDFGKAIDYAIKNLEK